MKDERVLVCMSSFDMSMGHDRYSWLFSDLRIAFKWGLQVNLLSKVIPRYMAWEFIEEYI